MEKKVRTVCFDCHSKCGVILTVNDNDEIVRVEGDKNNPVNDGILCVKAFSAQEIHAHPDRLKYPLKRAGKRGEGKWERITWDEALDIIEKKIRETIEEYGPQSVIISQGTGRGSNHFLDRLNNTWNGGGKVWPTHVCLLPNLAQTHVTYGRMFHPHEACDYRNAGSIVMWGTNPIRSRQYSGLRIMDAKRNGSRVVVVDPVFRDIAAKADLVPVRPGTDGALALGLTNLMFQSGKFLAAEEMLTTWTNAPFLVDNEARMMMRESDLVEGGSDDYVVWGQDRRRPGYLASRDRGLRPRGREALAHGRLRGHAQGRQHQDVQDRPRDVQGRGGRLDAREGVGRHVGPGGEDPGDVRHHHEPD